MSESFDPYRVWLAIPPESRPPTHYELLGVSPQENDLAVINAAMLRQSGYVRNFQIGKYAKEAARVLNEIAAAKACLLDPAKRAKYDADLRTRQTAAGRARHQAAAPPAPAPLRPAIDLDQLAASAALSAAAPLGRPTGATRRFVTPRNKRKPSAFPWRVTVAVAATVAVVGFGFDMLRPRGEVAPSEPGTAANRAPDAGQSGGRPGTVAEAHRSEPPAKNHSPSVEIIGVEPPDPKAGGSLTIRLAGHDPDDDAIAFEYRKGADGAWQIAPDGLVSLAQLEAGPLSVQVRARDGNGALSEIVTRAWELKVAVPPAAIVPFSPEQAKKYQEAWAKYLKRPVVETNSIGMKQVLIPPGKFMMGTATGGGDNEKPTHEVTLNKPFYLGEGEVTVAQFGHFIDDAAYSAGEKPEQWPGAISPMPDCPVNNVSWFDAILFCNWLSAMERRKPAYERTGEKTEIDNTVRDVWHCDFAADGYRLPTEAEWEYACRSGSSGHFCYGNDEALLSQYASFFGNAHGRTWPAGTRLANALGLFDMHGNNWEWCWDWHAPYGAPALNDPVGPVAGFARTVRGGAFENPASYCRSAHRGSYPPMTRNDHTGFRVLAPYTNLPTPPSSEVSSDPVDPATLDSPLLDGAVAWYRAENNAIDSARGHNGTLHGGASYTDGSVNRSFKLDGASGYVQVPDDPMWDFGSNELTIDAWVNFTSIRNGSLPAIVAHDEGGGGTNKWIYGYDGASFFLHINDPANGAIWLRSAPYALNMNEWYNVALSRNGTTFTFFANGLAIGADTSSLAFPAVSAPLTIGFSEGLEYLHGLIDDVVLFDRALSENEIETIYRGTSNGKVMPVPPLRPPKEL